MLHPSFVARHARSRLVHVARERDWVPTPGAVAGGDGGRKKSVFSGGYRVAVPMTGALMQRVGGVDANSFTSIMMVGIPVLTGLVLSAAAFRSRRDPLVVYLMMLAAAAMFLTEPYIGYLDDATVLLLLSMSLAFVGASRSSWGARAALFMIGLAAAFVHPTTCGLFGISLLGVFGFHIVTSRFKLRRSAPPRRADAAFGRSGDGDRPVLLGHRDLGAEGEVLRCRRGSPLHEEVLRGSAQRVGPVYAPADHRAAHPRRYRFGGSASPALARAR